MRPSLLFLPLFLCPALAWGEPSKTYSSLTIRITDQQTGSIRQVVATPELLRVEETGARRPKIGVFRDWDALAQTLDSLDLAHIASRALTSETAPNRQSAMEIALIESGTATVTNFLFLQEDSNPVFQTFQPVINLLGTPALVIWGQDNHLYRHAYQDPDGSSHLTMTQAVSMEAANILFSQRFPAAQLLKSSPITIRRDDGSPSEDSLQAYLYSLLGSEIGDARPRLLRSGYQVRIVSQDGQKLEIEDDLRSDRVNISLEKGRVVLLSIE